MAVICSYLPCTLISPTSGKNTTCSLNMSVRHVVPGVFIRLKSITTPLKVKLKLVKYSWLSESVIIPNKTEVLLDFIAGLLLNKKRNNLSDEDFEVIWHCLEWLLLTKKMQQRLSKKQIVVLKPSFSSILISSLTNVSQNKLKYSDSVITCCKLLLSSPALSYLFTSNIENMANLLSAVSIISLQQLAATGCMEQHIDDMLSSLIKSFCDCQKISCNQAQVLRLFYNKLFQSVLILQYKCQHHSDYNHISCLLDEMIKNTVFNKDQRLLFRKLQKLSAATKPGLSQLFTIMKEAITGADNGALAIDFRAAVLDYLPKLFALFIEGETESSASIQIMLDNISKLLGFDLEQGKFHGAVEENKAIEIMGQLLDRINNMNIYNLSAHDDNEEKFWFMYSKQLPQILFTAERKTDSWFLCLKSLILLNPDISKEYLDHILSVCWSVLSESDQSTIEQVDGLLESILDVYSKLRQIPFLFEKLIASVIASSVKYNCKWPQRFSVKFQNIVQKLHQTVALQIWEMLLTAIEKELTPMLKDDEGDDSISNQKPVCSCIIGLLLNFLGDVVVVGPTVTAKNTLAIQNLQTRMKVSIVVPSIYLCLSKPNCDPHLLEAALLLIYEWWEIAFILAYYTPPGQEEFLLDLSTFNFLSTSIRKKIFKSVGNGSLVCYLLQLQCIRAVQVFPESETEKKKAKICDLSGIINMLMSKEISEVPAENQNEIVHPRIPVRTMKQATWWFLTTNFPILFPLFTLQDILVISQYIVRSLTDTVEHTEREMLTEAGFTWDLIRSPFFQEMASFHPHIISCIFSTLADSMLKNDSSLPEDMKTAAHIFSTLGNSELQWNNPNDINTSKALKIVGRDLCSLFENSVTQSDTQEMFLQKFSTIIKIIQLLPLRFLPPNEKLQIIFGLHLVISCCPVSNICPENSNLVNTVPNDQKLSLITNCIDCLSTLMMSSENVFIYSYLRPEIVLNFLETSLSKIQEQKSNSQPTLLMCYYRLLEYSISSMFGGFTLCSILENYIMELLKCLRKAKDRICKQSHSMEYIQKKYSLKFLFASKFIEELGKILQQKTLSEDTRAIATKYMEMFSDVVLKMVTSIDSDVADCVLAVYTSLLESQKNTSDGQKVLRDKHNPRLSVCCLNNISKKENFTSLLLSVQFFKFSLNQASAIISPKEHSNLWNCLKDLLSFLLTSSTVTQKTQSSSTASIENSLNTAVAFTLLSNFSDLQLASLCAPSSTTPTTIDNQLQFYSRQNCIQSLYIAVKSTMLSLITAMSCKEQHVHLENLALCLKTDDGLNNFAEISTAAEVFQILLEKNVFDENAQLQKTILNSTQLIFQQLQWHCNMDKMTKIFIPLLHLEVKMLKKNIPPQTALHVIFGCQFVPLSNLDAATFEAVFQALYDVLNILLTEYTDVILLTLPSFIGIVKRLIIALVGEGTQDKLSNNKSAEKAICNCANLLLRLINNMSIHKSELNSVVNYVIAEFIAAYSNVTLLPAVKNILNSSLYCLLMSCNNHMLNGLNAILPQSMKQVFQSIYTIYSKNYEYKGYI